MVQKIKLSDYRVKRDSKICLADWPTRVEPLYASKKSYRKLLSAGPRWRPSAVVWRRDVRR